MYEFKNGFKTNFTPKEMLERYASLHDECNSCLLSKFVMKEPKNCEGCQVKFWILELKEAFRSEGIEI